METELPFEMLTPELNAKYLGYLRLQLETAKLIDDNPPLRELLKLLRGESSTEPGRIRSSPVVWQESPLCIEDVSRQLPSGPVDSQ